MIARYLFTLVMLLLAFYGFWGNALGAGHIFNPFGLSFLLGAAAVWFKWEMVRSAFRSVKDESDIPILRMGYKILQGMGAKLPPASTPSGGSPSSR